MAILPEHTILAAFTVEAPTREAAHHTLMAHLPKVQGQLTSWWVAEDDRQDGSDNDSAVFCRRGRQHVAHEALVTANLTEEHNKPIREAKGMQLEMLMMLVDAETALDNTTDPDAESYYEGKVSVLTELIARNEWSI